MAKKIFPILSILALGALGAMIWQAIFLPYLAQNSFFKDFEFVKVLTERETLIFPKEQIYIQENIALTKAIEKAEKSVIAIKTQTPGGRILQGSGLILTADGLVVTLADLVPRGSDFNFYVNEQAMSFEILKRDIQKNLALIKIENGKQNFSTCGFADLEKIKKGQIVFLIGTIFFDNKPEKIVNQGIIKYFNDNYIQTNIFEEKTLSGSALFDIESNVLGLNTINSKDEIITIPIDQIQDFAGF